MKTENKTKTEILKGLVAKELWLEAFSLANGFKIWDNKEDREVIRLAHEMKHSQKFYESMGYDMDLIQDQAKKILTRIYITEKEVA